MLKQLLLLAIPFVTSAATFPNPATDIPASNAKPKETVVFAGGCFWGVEAVFESLKGVENAVSGYAGGAKATANYETVSTGRTGHAESVEITYDPTKITYGQLLKVFFAVAHDPTEKDYQGPDHGHQYRSAIFYRDDEQKKIAEAYIKQLEDAKVFSKPIVTEVTSLNKFYPAEGYHQQFVKHNPNYPYVVYNDLPKLAKLKQEFTPLLKK